MTIRCIFHSALCRQRYNHCRKLLDLLLPRAQSAGKYLQIHTGLRLQASRYTLALLEHLGIIIPDLIRIKGEERTA